MTDDATNEAADGHRAAPSQAVPDVMPEPQMEWAVEITWRDPEAAGARGPTSQYGPMQTPEHLAAFLETQRRDRAVAATRVLTRWASYTPWAASGDPEPTSEEERLRLHQKMFDWITRPET